LTGIRGERDIKDRGELARRLRLYLVTDRKSTGGRPLVDVVGAALRGGVDAVQLREKDLSARELCELAVALRAICSRYNAALLINDRIDVALAANADGVHLPVDSFHIDDARGLLGPDKLIGASTHSVEEARAAAMAGADFVVFGPLFDTASKRIYGKPLGVDAVDEVVRRVRVPVLGIGGISPERAVLVCGRGASGVAAVSGILQAPDPEAAARAYLRRLPFQ